MKKLLLSSALFISFLTFAQVPQGISYQAIALNGAGTPVASSNVRVKLSILDVSAAGTVLYSETQLKTTNAQGLFNLVIGQGTLVSGVFNTINWGTNSKFLKVEMDATGGTTYAAVGTTQLLTVPYALAADSLVTSAGEGITLVSPNGTPYQLTVNDAGTLSLPTSGASSNIPSQLYLYGSFNSFSVNSSLQMGVANNLGPTFFGYKYLTSGTQLKFIPNNISDSVNYGANGNLDLTLNGVAFTIQSTGFYFIKLNDSSAPTNTIGEYAYQAVSSIPRLNRITSTMPPSSYNSTTNTFSYNVSVTSSNPSFNFIIDNPFSTSTNNQVNYFGDNLSDGNLDYTGTSMLFPNTTTTAKNYRVDLMINFNGSASYTVTEL